MSELAHAPEHRNPDDAAASQELHVVSSGFRRIARLRERAAELRQSNEKKAETYDPLEAITIPGGSRMVAGFVGMVLREVAVEVHADILDAKADKLTQQLIEPDIAK